MLVKSSRYKIDNTSLLLHTLSLTDPVKHKSNLQKQIIPEAECILQVTDPN